MSPEEFLAAATQWLPLLATLALVAAVLTLVNWILGRRWQGRADTAFRFKLIMLALTLSGLVAVLVALPITDTLRGQLLSLLGILLSAAIALSSTTFIGNIMAGIMLRSVRSARPGDFITVADLTGRITMMDLLHTEIQTEFRDLVTVPNIFMVTQPMKVVRQSGTIVSAEVSLGYDIPRGLVMDTLRTAATESGLADAFVHVRELGDFAVTYRVAGLLQQVDSLISARSTLREEVLDALHQAGIEVVSPNFMNTRQLPQEARVIPAAGGADVARARRRAEAIAFDKAEEAASVEDIREMIVAVDDELSNVDKRDGEAAEEKTRLETRKARLELQLGAAETRLKTSSEG